MEHSIEYKNNLIYITADGVTWNIGRGRSDEQDQEMIASHLEMLEREAFYKSEGFTKEAKNVSVHIRAEENLAKEFKRVCEQQGYTQSLVMRELMKDYIKRNEQLDLLK